MGRAIITARYEITPEIKELQKLGKDVQGVGTEVYIDITKDEVVINGHRKMTRKDAKVYLLQLIENNKKAEGTSTYPDQEELAKEEKRKAKLARKNRKPGTPPELKTLIRRAKRIFKKAIIKGIGKTEASAKATEYIKKKANDDNDLNLAASELVNYIERQ